MRERVCNFAREMLILGLHNNLVRTIPRFARTVAFAR